jgi:hypothetical protein
MMRTGHTPEGLASGQTHCLNAQPCL